MFDAFADPQVQRLFSQAAQHTFGALKEPAKNAGIKLLASFRGYEPYLAETYRRVSTFRSFANPAETVQVVDQFVPTYFTSEATRTPDFDQDELIERLIQGHRYVVSGFAGYGKSMVMRYVALSLYEAPRGRIPLFIELRNLNRLETPNLLAYVNSTYAQGSSVSLEAFRRGMESGLFVILLDGFDEINHEIRRDLESQILEMAVAFPRTSIVVSGRPHDSRYGSWRDFELIKIKPMSKLQVLQLIKNLNYDNGVKRRFSKKVSDGLYESHQSFMSTPLLAILMLLTFEKNSNIPDKMYLFYGKAFETLFNQHDATKEQYDRSRKSTLQIDEFQNIFATFCVTTYVEEKTEFTQVEIHQKLREAVKYNAVDTSVGDYLSDLEEAVCLMVKEGHSYFFVHRSFQEYFTAVFLRNAPETDRDKFLDGVGNRPWDGVLPMLFDMASDQIEATWLPRRMEQYLNAVGHEAGKMTPFEALWSGFVFQKRSGRCTLVHIRPGPFRSLVSTFQGFYPEVVPDLDIQFGKLERYAFKHWDELESAGEEKYSLGDEGDVHEKDVPLAAIPSPIVASTNLVRLADEEFKRLKRLQLRTLRSRRVKGGYLDKLFLGNA